ncbi:predicted protein [Aspergillus nidulans FGSC A4]|uniref:Uncharacterized protein n=1 Tax=Emericella nidulans (strain FGSC A4 / ATCC 38163 / CBS 112.46 / NRRL 194 / M139) TaxID=227321 RepID=Q5AZC3_EMENI|nr:hypothetical protein [Aspergillus nidulans FGSC A4]EAA58741.1 predicted protein [Aspergillus nidulans FGSC A4]CBF69633.1 TPA: hypothetical protein ANIA_06357 [Aspergillus nidulans FGSC A4]|eukprot:XP_663961.1 predicted protein [Aspergillus nidulans FGSC A4]
MIFTANRITTLTIPVAWVSERDILPVESVYRKVCLYHGRNPPMKSAGRIVTIKNKGSSGKKPEGMASSIEKKIYIPPGLNRSTSMGCFGIAYQDQSQYLSTVALSQQ